jgi:hypothetical protein
MAGNTELGQTFAIALEPHSRGIESAWNGHATFALPEIVSERERSAGDSVHGVSEQFLTPRGAFPTAIGF